MVEAFGILLSALVTALSLWLAGRLIGVQCTFVNLLLIGVVASFLLSPVLSLVPIIGWILCTVALLTMICKLTSAEFWPDAVLMVIVALLVSLAINAVMGNIIGAAEQITPQ